MSYSAQTLEDIDALVNDLLPFAEKMLRKYGDFVPFSGYTQPDGVIVWQGADDAIDPPPSQDLIEIMHDSHRQLAKNHELRTCAVVYNIRTTPPGKSRVRDAICMSIDHISGLSAHVVYPYRLTPLRKLTVEEAYAFPGDGSIFPRANA